MFETGSHPGIPHRMTLGAARFFASDWEAMSFIEFFVDLQLRVADDQQASVGRTLARLEDHSRFALQMVLVRSVDSFLAYLGEMEAAIQASRRSIPWEGLLLDAVASKASEVPVDAGERYLPALAHGNVRHLDRLFSETTGIDLFADSEEVAIFTRLVSIRNLVAHGRTFASDELASLVDETVSVGGLGLRWKEIRGDLSFLRASVMRIDCEAAERWRLDCPVSRETLFASISAAAKVVADETDNVEISRLSAES